MRAGREVEEEATLCAQGRSSHCSSPEFTENLSFSPTLTSISPVVGVELETWGHLLPWAVLIYLQDHPLPTSSDLAGVFGTPAWAAAPKATLTTGVFKALRQVCS